MLPRRPLCRISSRLATGHRLSRSRGLRSLPQLIYYYSCFENMCWEFCGTNDFSFSIFFSPHPPIKPTITKQTFVPAKTQKKRPLEDSRVSSFGLRPFDKTIMRSELTSPFQDTITQSSSPVLRNPRRPRMANPPNNPRSRLD